MTFLRSRFVLPALLLAVAAMSGGDAVRSQPAGARGTPGAGAPDATGPGARGAQPAAAGGGPRGSAPLGDGPWDFDTETGRIRVTVVTKNIDHPWDIEFLPNGDMLVTERPGRLRVLRKDGTLDPTPLEGLPPVVAASIGGLQGLVLHPDFARNRTLYFAYSKANTDDPPLTTLAVARARWDGGAKLEDVKDIFLANTWYNQAMAGAANRCCGQGPASGSYGARMIFGDDGKLYVTVGDRNWGERAQDPSSHLGKIVRLNDDGTVPRDNPFRGREGWLPEIYTLGHRNPTGLTFNTLTDEIWSTEFGPRGGDELNRIEAGKNYGWMLVTQGEHYNDEPSARGNNNVAGMVDPVLFWGPPSINPGNLIFVDSALFPALKGNMLMAAMGRFLLRTTFDAQGKPTGQERLLGDLGQRLRDVAQAPDGSIYVLTDETAGAILKIEPAR